MASPNFSDRPKEYIDEYVNIRTAVDKKIWLSFKTLISLKRLDMKSVLSDIVRQWVINFGEIKYTCPNCGTVMSKDDCFIIVKHGFYVNCCSIRCFDMMCNEIDDILRKDEKFEECIQKYPR